MTDKDELREQYGNGGSRIAQAAEEQVDLEGSIEEMLEAIDRGEVKKNLSLRDETLAAILRGAEDVGELDAMADALADELGKDAGSVSRAEVLGLAARVGFQTALPEVLETATTKQGEIAKRNA